MEAILSIICVLLVIITFLGLLVTVYYNYVRGINSANFILRSIIAFFLFVLTSTFTLSFGGFVMFVGAHTKPLGQALNTEWRILYAFLIFGCGIIGWLLCSLVNGSLILLSLLKKQTKLR